MSDETQEIKRYDLFGPSIEESQIGEYIKFSDHKKIESALREQVEQLTTSLMNAVSDSLAHQKQNEDLEHTSENARQLFIEAKRRLEMAEARAMELEGALQWIIDESCEEKSVRKAEEALVGKREAGIQESLTTQEAEK